MIEYFLIINLIAFILYGIDKAKAKFDRWRIPEKTLLSLAIVGGFIGAIAGMQIWRHKTQKISFKLVNYGSLIIYVIIFILFV